MRFKRAHIRKKTHPTGYFLGWENTREGNALLSRKLFKEVYMRFNSALDLGGEDIELFRRKIEEGHLINGVKKLLMKKLNRKKT